MAHIRDLREVTKGTGKPYKGKKPWQVRYRDPQNRERAANFATKPQATRFMNQVATDVQKGQWIDPDRGRVRFADWVERWSATTVSGRPSTRARDESYIRTHVLPVFGDRRLSEIEQMDVAIWVASMTAAGKAPATVQKAYQLMSKIMRAAVASKTISASPCVEIDLPKIERDEMRFLNPAEVAALADAIHPRYRAMVLLSAWGGLRMAELAGLKRERVRPLQRRVEIVEILVEVGGHLHWGQPKTKAGRRSIVLPSFVMDELVRHMEEWSSDELVFTAPEGGPLRRNAWRRRFWMPGVKAAGLAPLRPHDLRHTAVALWIAAGAKPLEVTRRAGHTSTSFTQDRYGHLFPESEDDLADRLGNMAAAAQPATVHPMRVEAS